MIICVYFYAWYRRTYHIYIYIYIYIYIHIFTLHTYYLTYPVVCFVLPCFAVEPWTMNNILISHLIILAGWQVSVLWVGSKPPITINNGGCRTPISWPIKHDWSWFINKITHIFDTETKNWLVVAPLWNNPLNHYIIQHWATFHSLKPKPWYSIGVSPSIQLNSQNWHIIETASCFCLNARITV